MYKSLVALVLGFSISACASTAKYSSNDAVGDNIRFALGSNDGVKVGDKISVLERDCTPDGKSRGCRYTTVGHLTVTKNDGEKSSLAKSDENIKFGDNTYFSK